MDLDLKGRRVLITGGSKGLGLATARRFASEGCDLCLAARSQAVLDAAAQSVRDAYPVKVVFSNGAQEFVAGEHLVLKRGGQTLVEMDCAGPWVLFKAPAGRYTVAAWLEGQADNTYSADFSTDGPDARQQRLDISFSAPRKDQTTMPQDTSK